jgi:hypothetical protein
MVTSPCKCRVRKEVSTVFQWLKKLFRRKKKKTAVEPISKGKVVKSISFTTQIVEQPDIAVHSAPKREYRMSWEEWKENNRRLDQLRAL